MGRGKEGLVAVEPAVIRNVCLIGHRGSGKTAIAETMIGLASGGAVLRGITSSTTPTRRPSAG